MRLDGPKHRSVLLGAPVGLQKCAGVDAGHSDGLANVLAYLGSRHHVVDVHLAVSGLVLLSAQPRPQRNLRARWADVGNKGVCEAEQVVDLVLETVLVHHVFGTGLHRSPVVHPVRASVGPTQHVPARPFIPKVFPVRTNGGIPKPLCGIEVVVAFAFHSILARLV
jgi:hypothetical protein